MTAGAWLLVLILLVSALAGCVREEDGLTAKEAVLRTRDKALAWHGDAELSGVYGSEVRREAGAVVVPMDARFGDGRGAVWEIRYQSRVANATLDFLVTGTNVSSRQGPLDLLERPPVGPWRVDSPTLIDILRTVSETRSILDASDAVIRMQLETPIGATDAKWTFQATSSALARSVNGVVDAQSGQLHIENLAALPGPGVPTQFRVDGTIGPQDSARREPFQVHQDHATMTIELTATGMLPGDGASYEILDSAGQSLSRGQSQGGNAFRDRVILPATAGTFEAVVQFWAPVPGPGAPLQRASYVLEIRLT